MKTIVIIQARMGSSRLPGKVLFPLGNEDVLTYVIERCKLIKGIDEVIVATSNLLIDDSIEKWCSNNNIICYRGSEENVLQRYIDVANVYNPNYIVRVTADCPFIDYEMITEMIEKIKEENVQIIDIIDEIPRGLAGEVFSKELLEEVARKASESRHYEHVTYYAYEYPKEFTRSNYKVSKTLINKSYRITLDTEDDYKLIQQIAHAFKNKINMPTEDIIEYLERNPLAANINAHVEQKPVI